ncbi:hypothetical protein [Actinoplanes sp. DH11]|uniref:hypothetical protein n=1 Tax=Actinoplanes sp. DH11 TaxID=2857011 RepID=UPI001E46D49D|nr:hypothetical protein [Actinoplanes sp. DH11]
MRVKAGFVALGVVLLTGAGLVAGGFGRQEAGAAPVTAADLMIDEAVPEHQLLRDVLVIDLERRNGELRHFAYLPEHRPPGLTGMNIGSDDVGHGSVVDGYHLGRSQVLVELAPRQTGLCRIIREGQLTAASRCLRDDAVDGVPEFRRVTAYSSDRGADGAFWARTAMVPLAEAGWFTELVARGNAALADH